MTITPPVERNPLPTAYWEYRDARYGDYPDVEFLIPGLLPVGLTVLVAPPKIGKSMLGMQVEHYLSAGVELFGYRADAKYRCLVIDLEGNARRTRQRHWQLLPRFPGNPATDGSELAEAAHGDNWYIHGNDLDSGFVQTFGVKDRIAWLGSYLDSAASHGYRFKHVRIDTLRLFLGAKPREMNAYDYDAMVGRWLDELAQQRGISILVPHHTRKSSGSDEDWLERVSGSTGIAGSASCIWLLDRNRGRPEGVLRVAPRDDEESEVPVRFHNGRYSFADDLTSAQARHTGGPRAVLDFLNEHRTATFTELMMGTGLEKNQVGKIVGRLADSGEIESARGRWRIVPTGIGIHADLLDVIDEEETAAGRPPLIPAKSSASSGSSSPEETPAAEKSAVDEGTDQQQATEPADPPRGNPAITALCQSIEAARVYAVPLIAAELRGREPWVLADALQVGRHKWFTPELDDYDDSWDVVLLDRNGSYPSVLSSVPVASSTLVHTGACGYDPDRAGMYLIQPEPWVDGRPHPLGVAGWSRDPVWITAPHVELLAKLGRLPGILDSWTGRRCTTLFERFYRWAKEARESATPETATETKRQTNIAIRSLWLKGVKDDGTPDNKGRLWRPDWHTAILAESNVRHWVKVDRARYHGRLILAVTNTDEVALAIPADADLTPELVHPYVLGTGYGQVKVKDRQPFTAWRATVRR